MNTVAARFAVRDMGRWTWMWTGGLALVVVLWGLMITGHLGLLLALLMASMLSILGIWRKDAALLLSFVYLIVLGDLRRLVSLLGTSEQPDPLLMVAPFIAFSLALPFLLKLRLHDTLSRVALGLLVVMSLEVVNPLQGGLAVGFAGIFFYIVPVLWFWVGRGIGSPVLVHRLIYRVVLPLSVVAAILGLSQTFLGFLPYQQAWINSVRSTYTSIFVGSSVRPFGYSVSAAEYATLLCLACAAIVAAFYAYRRSWILLLPLLLVAFLLAGGRGLTVKLIFALVVLWVMKRNVQFTPMTLISIIIGGTLTLTAASLLAAKLIPESGGRGSSAAQESIAHLAGGIAHPFDDRYSSAGLHSNMVMNAMTSGLRYPLGRGLGATTMVGAQAGEDQGSSEVDFTDMFVCLGLLGGALYLGFVLLAIREAYRYTLVVPRSTSLPVFAILISTVTCWLLGGQYSTAALDFFLVGSLVYRKDQSQLTAT